MNLKKHLSSSMEGTYQPTREEEYIKNYLEQSRISFKEQLILRNLKGDTKKERRVDFYLNKLDIYLEYYGLYNSTKTIRNEYDQKTHVYFKNGLPTVIIYPHELGILDYAFHTKVLKLYSLEKFNNKKKYYRYMLFRYYEKGNWKYLLTTIFWTFLLTVFGNDWVELDDNLTMIFFVICWFYTSYYTANFIYNLVVFIRYRGVLD